MTDPQKQEKPARYRTFAEVYPKGEAYPGVKQVKLDDILDKEILIKEYQRRPSKFEDSREMVVIHGFSKAVNPNPSYDFAVATGSTTIIQQLEVTKSKLPYRARIVKPAGKKYYSLA